MNRIPMTVFGEKQLREKLKQLKTVDRPAVIKAISEAREHGDLKENAEYHAAREQQGFIEGRIMEVEGKLGNVQVIDVASIPNNGKVIFGSTVTLADLDSDKTLRYQIVGDDEADVNSGKISVNSPIARAVVGKSVEDVVGVNTPAGMVEYEIEKVEYI